MPTLRQLQDTTTPIRVKRGAVEFVLNAALEKLCAESDPQYVTTEGVTYKELRAESAQVFTEKQKLNLQLNNAVGKIAECASDSILRAQVIEMRTCQDGMTKRKATIEEVTTSELQAAFDELKAPHEAEVDRIEIELKANDEARCLNLARRLAFLVAGSDLTGDSGEPALSGVVAKTREQFEADTQVFYKNFGEQLMLGCLEEIESAVFGPLVTSA